MIEIIIVAIALTLVVLAAIGMKLYRNHAHYNEKIIRALGIRHLTFQRKCDILIAIGLVGSFLAAILLIGPK
jgi:hypothetical protein